MNKSTSELNKKIVKWALLIKSWGIKWETGIYPAEMAAFLGLCEQEQIGAIVESGRGDHAYSTQILAAYGKQMSVPIVSMDVTPIEKKVFKEVLSSYENLHCLTGDAFNILPRAIKGLDGTVALLVDGPKTELANTLSFVASTVFTDIHVIAHHNCPAESSWGEQFTQMFPGRFHYEDLELDGIQEWAEFKKWEAQWVGDYELYDEVHQVVGRSLQTSSLAMAILPSGQRPARRVFDLKGETLRYHPVLLWIKWSLSRMFHI
jgi:hypothetical protein